ncbi:MAG: hypothetical protein HYZ54_12445 [Ignavibacteriae bacterium]|nr:hypothetical protein [Ignavibacteriota bacterium]
MKVFLNKLYSTLITIVVLLLLHSDVFCQYSQGLVGHWSFDDCTAKDSSINQFNGIPNPEIVCIKGIQGQAFVFDGNSDFIDIGNKSLFNNGDDFTITAWIKIQPNSGDDGFSAIITKWENSGGPQEWWFGVYKDELHFTSQGYPCATDCPERMSNGLDLYNNCWTFVGVIVTNNNRVQYIKDGKIIDEDKTKYSFSPQATSIRIGRQNPNNRPAARFSGGIDEVRVYNRALDPIEIESLYLKDFRPPEKSTRYSEVRICKGDSISINGNVTYSAQYNWSPPYNLSCINCSNTISYPDSTTLYSCDAVPLKGCQIISTQVKVIVDTIPKSPIDFRLSRDCKVTPDARFEMNVTTNDNLNLSGIKEFTSKITFDNRWMFLDSTIGIPTIRRGKALDQSWIIAKNVFTKDSLSTVSIWCKGETPIEKGDSLLSVAFRSYLPDVLQYQPTLTVAVKSSIGCFAPSIASGLVSLQSCFIGARRINVSNTSYSLAVINEQKSSDNITILYSIGLKGKTTIEIFDSEGKLHKQLIDEIQENGEYSLSIFPSLPSGFYFCRMKSGFYDHTAGFVIAR